VGKGHEVSGSDLRAGAALDAVVDIGVAVTIGHHPEAVTGAALVVASSAVPEYDEELAAARRSGMPVWRRPQLLAALSSEMPTIGATGTHGKTTTTAMLVTALLEMGEDPSFVVGGDLVGVGTNGHWGSSELFVLEADEAFRTFESLELAGLVITNVEHEHVDHFGSARELIDSFTGVARKVGGPVVVCIDDAGSREVGEAIGAVTYGFDDRADWRLSDLRMSNGAVAFQVGRNGRSTGVRLSHPGRHMALNAAGALALLVELGRDPSEVARGIASYRGVSRRWEHRGTVGGVVLYDDYAHHPTEVAAVLDAALGTVPGRIWAVFQPHLYSRTERFSQEFGTALTGADVIVVTDVFGAREEPVPGVTGELVADAARAAGGNVDYVPHRNELAAFVAPKLEAGDLVISLGAGDITLLHTELAPMLAARS
jgi:UDP-N-acetylmuramate--alanine ligase